MTARTTFGRVAAVFAAVAVLATSAYSASAQTMTEAELRAEIARLSALLSPTTTSAAVAGTLSCPVDPATITSAGLLKMGMTSANVKNLQVLLNYFASAKGLNTRVAVSGAGSAGMETSYFGPATQAAVSNFQAAYRAEILTPLGLTAPTGIWAGSTNAQAVLLCTKVVTPTDPEDPKPNPNDLEGGEATISRFDVRSGDDVSEGEMSTVATVEFTAKDADLMVERLDLQFKNQSTSTSPWTVFENVSLEVDGDELDSLDASDRDNWSKDSGGWYRLRFSGLEEVVREDDIAQIDVVVETAATVRNLDQTWTVQVPVNGMRTVDGEGLNDYNSTLQSVDFDVVSETTGTDLKVRKSSDNPSATSFEVETDGRSDDYTVLGFQLKAEDVDAIINGATFELEFSNNNYAAIVDRATLELDGTSFSVDAVGSTTAATTTLSFDVDGDVEVGEDETVDGELVLRFRSTSSYASGTTVKAKLTKVDAETYSGASLDQTTVVSGETHTLVSRGLTGVAGSKADPRTTTNSNGQTIQAEFTVTFDITAYQDDFYVPFGASSTGSTGTDAFGAHFRVEDANTGADVTSSANVIAAIFSTSDPDVDTDSTNNVYALSEGEVGTFTLKVTIDPSATGGYRLQLRGLNYLDTAAATTGSYWTALPEANFESKSATITG